MYVIKEFLLPKDIENHKEFFIQMPARPEILEVLNGWRGPRLIAKVNLNNKVVPIKFVLHIIGDEEPTRFHDDPLMDLYIGAFKKEVGGKNIRYYLFHTYTSDMDKDETVYT